uniref:Proline rich transmembrane protein 3 n=1 Tax=Anolis carolinensis TaxID=28377 RepID=G1KXY4_ANOCA|nr:PREDICTED: proline-rich transmembrane protein 3 [Anolis carolinensis]|eukprot:XP_016847200.1 PREDICTED: proline-rich transmembrane protein 3 [Anolis carolinensis]
MAAALDLILTLGLLLPALHLAFRLPTPESPAWDLPLNSAPGVPLPNSPSPGPPLSVVPAQLPSEPSSLEASSGEEESSDESWRGDSLAFIPGTPVPFDIPAVSSSSSEKPSGTSGVSLAPHLDAQGLPGVDNFTLSTVGTSSVQAEPGNIDFITVESSPDEEEDGPSLTSPGIEARSMDITVPASLPPLSTIQSSDTTASKEETKPSHHLDDFSVTTTLSPVPTVSTVPLVPLSTGSPDVKWLATEGTSLRSDTSKEQLESRILEQELNGGKQTTVKYLASYRSTQIYDGTQGQDDLSTTPAAGYTQNPPGPWRETVPVASTSHEPQFTMALDGKGQSSASLPGRPQLPVPEEISPSPSAPSPTEDMTGTSQGPVVRQRSTHWSLSVDTTQPPGSWNVSEKEKTPFHRSSSVTAGTKEAIDVAEPQRVRGAVNARAPVKYFGSSTPGQSSAVARNGPGTKQPDAAETHPPVKNSTTSARIQATPRRGLIRVTTQRVLQHPQLSRPEPSVPTLLPISSPPCPRQGGACSQLLPNQTLLHWGDLERTLSFAWVLHVYGSGALFLLLSVLSLACLGGSFALRVPHLPYIIAASTLLLLFGVLRATFFLADPYGSCGWLPTQAVRVLYTAPFPLLLTTFAVLLLRFFCQAHLEILPPKWQSLPVLVVMGCIQSAVLLAADFFSPPLHPAVPVAVHTLSCIAGICLLPATVFVYRQLQHTVAVEGTPQPGVWSAAWVLLACSGLALPCCGLQFYGVLWQAELLGQLDLFSWGWWFVQFWFRIGELLLSFALVFLAWQALCQRYGSTEHSCWTKLMRYFCTYHKAEVPEYPNNCYDWTGGVLEKVPNNDISKNLIRNPPSSGRVWALKDSNELRAATRQGASPSPVHPVYSPKCPNAAAATMGRSYTSICFERDSILSLAELEFRPPSPINLSRSIDEALFREHLVRDSIFLRSSLHFPSRLARQDSCSSLRGDCSTLSHTAQPLLSRPRRSSDPDCLYSLARASSMGELTTHSRGLVSEPPTDTSFDSFSRTSFSRASLKISWNPWRHGMSSPESLPPEELPSQAQLLPDDVPPAPSDSAPNSEREARRSFLALSKQVDSRSLSSETIEL